MPLLISIWPLYWQHLATRGEISQFRDLDFISFFFSFFPSSVEQLQRLLRILTNAPSVNIDNKTRFMQLFLPLSFYEAITVGVATLVRNIAIALRDNYHQEPYFPFNHTCFSLSFGSEIFMCAEEFSCDPFRPNEAKKDQPRKSKSWRAFYVIEKPEFCDSSNSQLSLRWEGLLSGVAS